MRCTLARACAAATLTLAGAVAPLAAQKAPDLGPNVILFDPSMPAALVQQRLDSIYQRQVRAEFGEERYALLFEPGTYAFDARVGYYTQIAGLGRSPDDVVVQGHVRAVSHNASRNVLTNFWRAAENLSITPPDGVDRWAVSQAAPYRRMHVRGALVLHDSGWASGGFMADTRVDGDVLAGPQQQWFTRNSQVRGWQGGHWNFVFLGTPGAPPDLTPDGDVAGAAAHGPIVTTIATTPVSREKPFLYMEKGGALRVFVPALRRNARGPSWGNRPTAGASLPLDRFLIARPEMSAAQINAQLARGKHLLLTPGIYRVSEPIRVTRPNTIVLGLGLATVRAENGARAMTVADVDGVEIAGILFDAGPVSSPVLLEVGPEGASSSHAASPIFLFDIFARVGGPGPGKAVASVIINSRDVVGDHFWLWRADHGQGVGWDVNPAASGLVVNGSDVTLYGLFVEHYQRYQVVWNGERGRTYFFQNEIPYDPPGQDAYMAGSTRGWAAYKVGDTVREHEAWGLGSYVYFPRHPEMVVDHAFEVPVTPGVRLHKVVTFSLGGGKGTIAHVVNDVGPMARQGDAQPTPLLVEYPER